MPNVLVLSFEGFSFSARQLYEQLLPKLLSRAAVHESATFQDALHYIHSGWPSIILVTDAVIANGEKDSQRLLDAIADYTKHGCTTILMGFFAAAVGHDDLDDMFKKNFDLHWRVAAYTKHDTRLCAPDESLIRTSSLVKELYPKALYLSRVSNAQMVYSASAGSATHTYAALGRVGLGKLGYIGDVNFGEEPERLILAMCHLDRSEDSLRELEDDMIGSA
ncbi:hypothetical protein K491DRAFT_694904 [Lophiostoma macrostomum CBS 122681]|uniref:Uncharacterized protein n=1 Tax=Lophiostoma macrostomum CBS 122681 TaxID=1314788 RepID=A0A6A6SZQ7_9PLEO|nr:hypothetical protein K491DRAFT_694904 [Lophiostoma macrostomum CBS 122681]